MGFNKVVTFAILLVGSLAVPAVPVQDDLSPWLYHVEPEARIIGGSQAADGSAPYMVALTQGTWVASFFCGGSLVSTRTVVTAAHCIDAVMWGGSLSSSVQGRVGTTRWSSGGTAYPINRGVMHPNYISSTIKNDIGILVTASAVVFNNIVRPVTLSYSWAGTGVLARANGWGRTIVGGASSATLLELTKQTIDGTVCQRQVATVAQSLNMLAPPVDPAIEICTFHSAGHGMCHGDSGSALIRVDNGQQIGIVSWGVPCARGAPDMFVRVSAYESWLGQNIV
ncbi:chymotrypsin-1-like isoform X2 [Pectinophora gossypiella]|uniref:chymotrypsin-1-like isoform X2 n=1 Tax=Pectinophora gossypiella TaxID=13191 RepID=UPI00214E3B44|nr:chymotrypsin-1-like isoform X2 [Pectinophora gossypiella]